FRGFLLEKPRRGARGNRRDGHQPVAGTHGILLRGTIWREPCQHVSLPAGDEGERRGERRNRRTEGQSFDERHSWFRDQVPRLRRRASAALDRGGREPLPPVGERAMNRQAILEGPVTRSLLALALPVLVVLAVQTLVGVAETYFVSFLGTAAIAGVALVFPLFMLMAMMSNGGIGGGVSAAIARAIGGKRAADAD